MNRESTGERHLKNIGTISPTLHLPKFLVNKVGSPNSHVQRLVCFRLCLLEAVGVLLRRDDTASRCSQLAGLESSRHLQEMTMISANPLSIGVVRLLNNAMEEEDPMPGNINPYTTVGAIAWYVFLGVCCGLPMLCTCVGCSYIKIRNRRDEDEQLRDAEESLDMEISRMEANVHAFGEQQQRRRRQELLNTFKEHTVVITTSHFEVGDEQRLTRIKEECTICLGTFAVGDVVVQSSNAACQHLFHQDCLMSWLMTQRSPLCPCCRQIFIHGLTKRPSFSFDDVEEAMERQDGADSTANNVQPQRHGEPRGSDGEDGSIPVVHASSIADEAATIPEPGTD